VEKIFFIDVISKIKDNNKFKNSMYFLLEKMFCMDEI